MNFALEYNTCPNIEITRLKKFTFGTKSKIRTGFLQTLEEFVQQNHLPAVVHDVAIRGVRRSRLGALKQVGVIAHFPQMHQDILQRGRADAVHGIEDGNVPQENVFIPRPLHGSQLDKQLDLRLGREIFLHVRLDATQQKGPEDGVEPLHEAHVRLACLVVKPWVEISGRLENVGQEKVQERPQFVEVVLQRGAGQEEASRWPKRPHCGGELPNKRTQKSPINKVRWK